MKNVARNYFYSRFRCECACFLCESSHDASTVASVVNKPGRAIEGAPTGVDTSISPRRQHLSTDIVESVRRKRPACSADRQQQEPSETENLGSYTAVYFHTRLTTGLK